MEELLKTLIKLSEITDLSQKRVTIAHERIDILNDRIEAQIIWIANLVERVRRLENEKSN